MAPPSSPSARRASSERETGERGAEPSVQRHEDARVPRFRNLMVNRAERGPVCSDSVVTSGGRREVLLENAELDVENMPLCIGDPDGRRRQNVAQLPDVRTELFGIDDADHT